MGNMIQPIIAGACLLWNINALAVDTATTNQSATPAGVAMPPPAEKVLVTAANEAMPIIGKILGIHACVRNWESLRLMNEYAIPGVDMAMLNPLNSDATFPNNEFNLKYHDYKKCLTLRTVDQWGFSPPNSLTFHATFYADDSGESVSFAYLFQKMDAGDWRVGLFRRISK